MFIRVLEDSVSLEDGARLFCASWDSYLFLSCKYFFLCETFIAGWVHSVWLARSRHRADDLNPSRYFSYSEF